MVKRSELPAEPRRDTTIVFSYSYRVSVSQLNLDYGRNAAVDAQVTALLKMGAPGIRRVVIRGFASPEGASDYNGSLSSRRASEMLRHLSPLLTDIPTTVAGGGIAWDELYDALGRYPAEWAPEARRIIAEVPVWVVEGGRVVDSRKSQLMMLRGGAAYKEMLPSLFPPLRRVQVEITFPYSPDMKLPEPEDAAYGTPVVSSSLSAGRDASLDAGSALRALCTSPTATAHRVPVLAFGTNLLHDGFLAPNVMLEVPLGLRWSLVGEYEFPWWVQRDNARALQFLGATLQFRRYFGRGAYLKGWYLGVGGGAAYGDLELKRSDGRQWEVAFLSAEAGYSADLGRDWRLQIGIGCGLGYTWYRDYYGYRSDRYLIKESEGQGFAPVPVVRIGVSKIIFRRAGYGR